MMDEQQVRKIVNDELQKVLSASDLIGRMANITEEEIKKEADPVRLEQLHNRLQHYISLGIEFNKSLF